VERRWLWKEGRIGDGGRTGESTRILVGLGDGLGLSRNVWKLGKGGRAGGLMCKDVLVGVGLRRKVCWAGRFVVMVISGRGRGIVDAPDVGLEAGSRRTMGR
jgi:hypothetical protein